MHSLAWQTAHLLNASGRYREKVTIKELIGFELKTLFWVDDVPMDSETMIAEKKAELAELKERFFDIIPTFEPPPADAIEIEM